MKDGKPGEQEDRRVEHVIPADAIKKGSYTIYIEVTANGMFGLGPYRYQTPDVRPLPSVPVSFRADSASPTANSL
jgi:alpha-mannosidase